jgi:hypothetical protein
VACPEEERRREVILNVPGPTGGVPTDPEHPWRMTNHEGFEVPLVTLIDEPSQKSVVRHPEETRVAPRRLRTRVDHASDRRCCTSLLLSG